MKIYSPELMQHGDRWCLFSPLRGKFICAGSFICDEWLSSHFDIPDNVRHIWLVVRDRPTSNSVKLRLSEFLGGDLCVNGRTEFIGIDLADLIAYHKLEGKTIHLSVEYA